LDFAYTVHTDVGHRCILARVNGKAVPLDAELENGDTVEIVTQKGSRPKLEWLAIAKTNQAKVKIKSYFASQDKDKNLKAGREQINSYLRRYGKSILTPSLSLLKNYAGQNLSMEEREKLVEEVGKGTQSASNVVKKIFTHDELLDLGRLKVLETRDKKIDTVASAPLVSPKHIIVGGLEGVEVSIAKCCAPTYGDDIVAYVSTMKSSAKIHKKDCSLIKKLDQNRVVKARFKGQDYSVSDLPGGVVGYGGMKPSVYRVKVKIEATSRIGLLGDLGSTIASNGVNIYSYSALPVDAKKDVYYIIMDLDVTGVDQFEKVLNSIEKVDGVSKVVKF
ncbi:MAG TPA: TGS domain-containing protein, partial [Candidatus Gracilibacteria bacterium]|nr:TGS domain-containing protein [Candidatus Gracilibacteria bacterium]